MQSRQHGITNSSAKGGGTQQFNQTQGSSQSQLAALSGSLNPQDLQAPSFNLPQAILWQIKFIISGITSKKACAAASQELQQLSENFGTEFDKYLLRELVEQIELRDPNKAAKDKTEGVKSQLLNAEMSRAALKPEFLTYFDEIISTTYGDRYTDFITELSRRLKLSSKMQLMVALSMAESCGHEARQECYGILKQKIIEYHSSGKTEVLEEYAVHRLNYIFKVYPEFNQTTDDQALTDAKKFLLDQNQFKPSQSVAMRLSIGDGDLLSCNPTAENPSNSLIRVGSGLDHLNQASRFMEPWELLLDLGHYSSFNYQILTMAMTDFKDINEKTMANTILHLAMKHTGQDDAASRIVFNTFEANKIGDPAPLNREPSDKQTTMNWHAGHFSRAFRENYSNLNWLRVFESFGSLTEGLGENVVLDQKAYTTLMQIFSKSKPQNLQVPLNLIIDRKWKCPSLQLSFIENVIEQYVEGDKTFSFAKLSRRSGTLSDITLHQDSTNELVDVWQSQDLVEILVSLSETSQFARVRKIFDTPIRVLPEYLLLNISKCQFTNGNILLDELISLLLPQFLTNHANSIPVLKKLWESNQALMIRGMCELCRHEQRIMNLSRVLDITQEIKDSLIKIVYCQDYDFAVNLGVLAGKRDFLHYDVWLKERIKGVGTPFVKALIRYINEQIIVPCREFMIRNGFANQHQPLSQEQIDTIDRMKETILERSHLSKERLCMTMEHLENPTNFNPPTVELQNARGPNQKIAQQMAQELTGEAGTPTSDYRISHEAMQQIKDLVAQYTILFPRQVVPTQNTEEIDKAANDYFQHIFSAEPDQVDSRIQELIVTMQNFKKSQVVKEQEIYACMLHGLFDEYRFLHKYPQQYLEKIAKLFGAIIKNKLLDNILQDIALKFVIEAFRREGRRQSFGIIVVREFFDCLPEFPKQFQDIYNIREKIRHKDQDLYERLGVLYNQTQLNQTVNTNFPSNDAEDTNQPAGNVSASFLSAENISAISDGESHTSMFSLTERDLEESKKSDFINNRNQQEATSTQAPRGAGKSKDAKSYVFQPEAESENTQSSGQNQNMFQSQPFTMVNQGKNNRQNQQNQSQSRKQSPPVQAQDAKGNQAPFVPSQMYKPQAAAPKQTEEMPIATGSLNVASSAFTLTPDPVSAAPAQAENKATAPAFTAPAAANSTTAINVNAKTFMPSGPPPAVEMNFAQVQSKIDASSPLTSNSQPAFNEHMAIQQAIDKKIEDARTNKTKLSLQDLIDDPNMEMPSQSVQDQIRLICNNTGKNNFKQKLEDLKELVVFKPANAAGKDEATVEQLKKNAEVNMQWFINFTLKTNHMQNRNQNLHHIYIELIKQLGPKDSVSRTIKHALEVFKRCMLIDEEDFNKLQQATSHMASGGAIKQYLSGLGQFLGSLTLASNRPILSKEIDLKQLLLQGFNHENRRLVVIFVCKILSQSNRSSIFKVSNPWINGLLQIMRDIFELCQQPGLADPIADMKMEIELLFKNLNIKNLNDIASSGTLKACQNNQFVSVSQQVELNHLLKKAPLIPTRVRPQRSRIQTQFGGLGQLGAGINEFTGEEYDDHSNQEYDNLSKISQLQPNISLQPQSIQKLTSKFNLTEQEVRNVLSEAVNASIIDILPPVVDRSVTIALITTRQLVLKDFAFDGDCNKVSQAADQIVRNLAGSLALVTCREPLRISLTNHLMEAIKMLCFNAGSVTGLYKAEHQADPTSHQAKMQEEMLNQYIKGEEEILHEIAQVAGKENLELGCNKIQKAVIEKALKKVREDSLMNKALEKRRIAQEAGQTYYRDEEMIQNLSELPPMLQPNQEGLTQAQMQVYNDFSRLSHNRLDQASLASLSVPGQDDVPAHLKMNQMQRSGVDQANQRLREPAVYDFNLDYILGEIEKAGCFSSVTRSLLTLKLNEMNKPLASNADQFARQSLKDNQYKLWSYVENKMVSICQSFDSNPSDTNPMIQVLSLIVNKYKADDYCKKLLGEVFLQMEEMYFLNVDLNILLMRNGIISVAEWDKQLALFIQDSPGQLQENELRFLAQFIDKSIFKLKFLKQDRIPNLIKVLEKLESSPGTDQQTLNLKRCFGNSLVRLRKEQPSAQENTLRAHYHAWVQLSYIDDPAAQEKEINNYFGPQGTLKIIQDQETLFAFCSVMIKTSIELALYTKSGEKRTNNNTLDYRFIDSFIKLVVLMLKLFDFNKHEFMSKIFEFIRLKLDDDHNSQGKQFNQKPYYRMLMNILTAVNMSDCFTQKTQKHILFDLADLLKDLNPNKYPAFAFAWLELISHKLFMPHFIKKVQTAAGGSQEAQSQTQGRSTNSSIAQAQAENQKWFKIKDLIVSCFLFLKHNMIPGRKQSAAMQSFYTATMRIVLVILLDYPEFLCDFHFCFVNALPDHAIQLKNMVLAAYPRHIQTPSPFVKDLKVDTIKEVKDPLILSNYEAYLSINNLKEDLENYFKSKKPALINEICNKMMQAKERINDKEIPSSTVINAVVLFIATQTCGERKPNSDLAQKENLELFKQIVLKLNDETRMYFLNSIVNELRYPNSHTYFFCLTLLFLFVESRPIVQQQISTILFERLQAHRPFPWGLMINFRELIQNAKYGFMKSPFISQNKVAIHFLFENRLKQFIQFIQQQQRQPQMPGQHQSYHMAQHQMQQQFHGLGGAPQPQEMTDLQHRSSAQGGLHHDAGVHQNQPF